MGTGRCVLGNKPMHAGIPFRNYWKNGVSDIRGWRVSQVIVRFGMYIMMSSSARSREGCGVRG